MTQTKSIRLPRKYSHFICNKSLLNTLILEREKNMIHCVPNARVLQTDEDWCLSYKLINSMRTIHCARHNNKKYINKHHNITVKT